MVTPRRAASTALTTEVVAGGKWIVVIPPASHTALHTAPNSSWLQVTLPTLMTCAPCATIARAMRGALAGFSDSSREKPRPQPQIGKLRGDRIVLAALAFCWA